MSKRADTARTGKTRRARAGTAAPSLPHERDESTERPGDEPLPANQVLGEQAHDDVQRGLLDTDRGPVLDRVYNEGAPADAAQEAALTLVAAKARRVRQKTLPRSPRSSANAGGHRTVIAAAERAVRGAASQA